MANVGFTAGVTNGNGAPQNANADDSKGHGVACAGIIAATQNNNIGISGVAPNVQIVPINIFPLVPNPPFNRGGAATSDQIAAAIDWAWNQAASDVLSCSWGGGSQSNNMDAAIGRARTQGRGNRGCPVVFASGNNAPNDPNVTYPGNVDGVITVGACNNAAPSGNIWYYSDRGASMDLVAPSGDIALMGDVTTTDRMGANGYETGNYTNRFGGTSAACPQVAGVAALMLSVNSSLTETQVRTTLQNTATDMGTTGFDNTFGYGRVNACAAVSSIAPASLFTISGSSTLCSSGTYTINTTFPVTWTVSPCGIVNPCSATGPQVTLTKQSNGIVTLTATIALCGVNKTVSIPVFVGIPDYAKISITPQGPIICPNVPVGFGAIYNNSCANTQPPNITNFTWTVSPSSAQIQNVDFGPGPGCNGTNHSKVTINFSSQSTQYNVKVTAQNACGTSSLSNAYAVTLSKTGCGGGSKFIVSPNPAQNSVTVSLNTTESINGSSKGFTILQIVDKFRNLKKLYKYSSSTTTAKLNISDLDTDVYILRIFDGKVWTNEQFIVKRN